MTDETNELLRQILDMQRQLLSAYQKEAERTSDFRIVAIESQRKIQKRAMIIGIIIGVSMGLLLLSIVARNK